MISKDLDDFIPGHGAEKGDNQDRRQAELLEHESPLRKGDGALDIDRRTVDSAPPLPPKARVPELIRLLVFERGGRCSRWSHSPRESLEESDMELTGGAEQEEKKEVQTGA